MSDKLIALLAIIFSATVAATASLTSEPWFRALCIFASVFVGLSSFRMIVVKDMRSE